MAQVREIVVVADRLTFDDLIMLDKAASGAVSMPSLVEMLDRVVEGGVRGLPLTAFPQIAETLRKTVEGIFATTPGTPAGN